MVDSYRQSSFGGKCLPLDTNIIGSAIKYGNLTTNDRLDTLGQPTKDAVHNIAASGQFLTELHYLSLYLIEMHSAQLKAEVPQLVATLSSNYKLYTENLKTFIQDKNSITAQITTLDEQFKRLKDDIKATININSPDQSSIVWARFEREASILYEQINGFMKTIVHATQDINNAQPVLKNKGLTVFETTNVTTVSNYSIFEQIDYELQKPSNQQLRIYWNCKLHKFFNILSEYDANLHRINSTKNGLVHVTPLSPAVTKSSGPNVAPIITERYTTTTQAEFDALAQPSIEMLEKSLGLVLEEFYSSANLHIQKLPPNSLLRKFCRPFGANNLTKSVYTRNLLPNYSKANMQFLIAPAAGENNGMMDYENVSSETLYEIEMPNHMVSMDRAGSIHFEPKPTWLGGSCCGNRSLYPLDRTYISSADGDSHSSSSSSVFGRGGATTTKRKTTSKRASTKRQRKSRDSDEDESSSEEDEEDIPQKKRVVDENAVTMTGRIKFQSVQGLYKMFQEISQMLKILKETTFNPFNSAIMSLKNHLDNIYYLQTIYATDGKDTRVKPIVVSVGAAEELLSIYKHLIKDNTSVSDMTKDLYTDAENFIAKALITMKRTDLSSVTTAPHDIHLPEKLRYSSHPGLVANYWQLYLMVNAYIQSIFTEASLFSNPNTGFSLGKLNMSEDSFELSDNNRVVKFRPSVGTHIDNFKNKLRLPYYERLYKKLEARKSTLQQVVDEANVLFNELDAQLSGTDNETLNRKKILRTIITKTTCGNTNSFGPKEVVADSVRGEPLRNIARKLYPSATQTLFETYANAHPANTLWDFMGSAEYAAMVDSDKDMLCFWATAFRERLTLETNLSASHPSRKFFEKGAILIDNLSRLIGIYRANSSPPYIAINTDSIDKLITQYKSSYDKLNMLGASSFEKKFSTPVIAKNLGIVDAFVNEGYGEFLKLQFDSVLWFMGPSGSGKTYTGYGEIGRSVIGLDTRFLSLPRTALYLRDYYFGCFFTYENFTRAINNPLIVNYGFAADGSVTFTENSKLTEGQVNLTSSGHLLDYKNKIDNVRKSPRLNLIRPTLANPSQSSRSFFAASVVDENQIEKHMVDTPGYESIPEPAFINPFLFIHQYIMRTLEGRTGGPTFTQNSYDLFYEGRMQALASALLTDGVFTLEELKPAGAANAHDWLRITNTLVPTPSGCNFDEHGITTDCTFEHLVNNTVGFFANKIETESKFLTNYKGFKSSENLTQDLDVSVRDNLCVLGVGGFTSKIKGEKTSGGMYRLDDYTKHNLCVNKKAATYIMWTWYIYNKLFSLPLPNMKIIKDRFLQMVSSQSHKDQILTATEACFFNNFNFWAQHATLRQGNKSLVGYFNDAVQKKTITTGDLFYEYMLVASDYVYSDFAANPGLARHKFASKTLKHQSSSSHNQISLSILMFNMRPYRNWDFEEILTHYNDFSTIFNPFLPLGDMDVFNKFMNGKPGSKNLFVTILNGDMSKVENYCTFLDIATVPTAAPAVVPVP